MKVKIIPTGGLCNRLRAIATGVAVAKNYHCPSVIYWNNSQGLKADYCELFKPIPQNDVKLIENKQWLYNINGTKDYLLRWFLLKTQFEQTVFNFNIYKDGEVYSKLKNNYSGSLLLISCHPMCTKYTIQGMFIPQDDIQQRINEVVAGFSEHTIGVHIRRTDNLISIQSSPLENFTKIMDAEIEKNANTKFYVASDDDEVKEHLKSMYPNSIITLMDDTNRNSLEGMKFAVLDLFCLSKTNKIIGSVGSSYSQIAAEIGGIEVKYAK